MFGGLGLVFGFGKPTFGLCCLTPYGCFRKLGVPYFGVLIIRILVLRVLYQGPLFSETPICIFQARDLPWVSREWKNGSNSSYNCTPFLHSLLTKGKGKGMFSAPCHPNPKTKHSAHRRLKWQGSVGRTRAGWLRGLRLCGSEFRMLQLARLCF